VDAGDHQTELMQSPKLYYFGLQGVPSRIVQREMIMKPVWIPTQDDQRTEGNAEREESSNRTHHKALPGVLLRSLG
jgi:hypothetical protein